MQAFERNMALVGWWARVDAGSNERGKRIRAFKLQAIAQSPSVAASIMSWERMHVQGLPGKANQSLQPAGCNSKFICGCFNHELGEDA